MLQAAEQLGEVEIVARGGEGTLVGEIERSAVVGQQCVADRGRRSPWAERIAGPRLFVEGPECRH